MLIVVLLLVFSFGLLATRNLALKYVEMYWSGKMEVCIFVFFFEPRN
jgi:hypothetical protein